MKLTKLVEAMIETALNNLVVPETTVITRDQSGLMQLWWIKVERGTAALPRRLVDQIWDSLNLVGGKWISDDAQARHAPMGTDAYHVPICRRYVHLKQRVDNGEVDCYELGRSRFVSGLLKKIFEGPVIAKAVTDPYEIKTVYAVEGLEFSTVEEAQQHVKRAKLFDLILSANAGAVYEDFKVAIEAMVKDGQKVIDILQGQ